MSDDEQNVEPGFRFDECIRITHDKFHSQVVLPKFITKHDDTTFFHLNIYRSRGIFRLLTCRVPEHANGSVVKRVVKKFINEMRYQRDAQVRENVAEADGKDRKFRGCLEPRNKKLKVHAVTRSNTVVVKLPTIEDVAEETIIKFYDDAKKRRNGNSEIWAALTNDSTEYLTRVIAHRVATYRPEDHVDDCEDLATDPDDRDAAHEHEDSDDREEDEGQGHEDGGCVDGGDDRKGDRRTDAHRKQPLQIKISRLFV